MAIDNRNSAVRHGYICLNGLQVQTWTRAHRCIYLPRAYANGILRARSKWIIARQVCTFGIYIMLVDKRANLSVIAHYRWSAPLPKCYQAIAKQRQLYPLDISSLRAPRRLGHLHAQLSLLEHPRTHQNRKTMSLSAMWKCTHGTHMMDDNSHHTWNHTHKYVCAVFIHTPSYTYTKPYDPYAYTYCMYASTNKNH